MSPKRRRSVGHGAAAYIVVAAALALCAQAGAAPRDTVELWYDAPAEQWTEALPIGNGRMAAMVFGGPAGERIQFNEETVWTGGPRSYAHAGAAETLPQLRQLLFDGKQKEAEQLAMERFMSEPLRQMAYQPLGDLELRFARQEAVTDYRRSLDLNTAIVTTSYKAGGVTFTRRVFASYPDRAIIVHLASDKPRSLDFIAAVTSPQSGLKWTAPDQRTLLMTGRVNDWVDYAGRKVPGQVQFATHLRLTATDGDISASSDQLYVKKATTATLVLTAATNFQDYKRLTADPVARSAADNSKAAAKGIDELSKTHLEDHQALFRRVTITLGPSSAKNDVATDERVVRYARDHDPALAALFFQYGRYLMIACSRPGCQPANLQGKWNDQLKPSWDSKYTVNINTEMNYWLTEPGNLAECGEPLFAALDEIAESGRVTAKVHYGADGWVLHHNFDLWRGTAPINNSNHGIWPTGGAWLCQHLWWHYLYNGDEDFLRKRAYPLMKDACEFFVDTLVEDPRSDDRWLISGPSNSPEQGGLVMGPTMDHQIIRELFANTIQAAETLDIDKEFGEKLANVRKRIAPNKIGQHGQLQEWLEDVDDPKNEHRHVSHLWGLHPGHEIGPETPELFAAARKSLEFRGDEGTGWSRAWKINFWARLRDGDRAHKVLSGLLTLLRSSKQEMQGGGVYPNLFDAHPPFQIDGNFGAAAGIAEMLLQSQRQTDDGEPLIELLPALPAAWSEGSVSGLRARGGVEVDVDWADGKLSKCRLRSTTGQPFVVQYGDQQQRLTLKSGEEATLDGKLQTIKVANESPHSEQPGVLSAEFIYEDAPFPSCHASTLAESSHGLVAAWFGGTRERHPDVGIWLSHRNNDGWTTPVEVANGAESPTKRYPTWNPVLFQPTRGPLMLFYKVGPSPSQWWGVLKTSADGGHTWSEATRLPDGILGPIKNKPVELANGDILSPSSSEHDGWRVHFERSTDGGKTWSATPPVNIGRAIDAIQPSILFHDDERLQAVGRTRSGRIFETWSDDDGKTWSELTLAALPNPNSGTDAVTLADGRQLVVYNHSEEARNPLNVAVSKDGKQWAAAAVLEDDATRHFAYPAVIQTADGLVHVTYTWNRERIKHVVLDPKKLAARAMEDGKWPAAP